MNPYSPIQPQSHFSNPSSTFNNDVSSQMNFDPGMRSPGVMTPQNANQYPNNAYNNTMNNMGQVVGNNYPTEQINPGLPTSPMGKPQLKRSRSRKITRKKTGSVDESAWNEDASNGAYKQRPLMQMTIGNMHQRLQPTFNTSLDGALQSSTSMMSPQSGNVQTFNLNTLMNQNKNKMMDKVRPSVVVCARWFLAIITLYMTLDFRRCLIQSCAGYGPVFDKPNSHFPCPHVQFLWVLGLGFF